VKEKDMSLSQALLDVLRQITRSSDWLTPAGQEVAQRFFDSIEQLLAPSEYIDVLTYTEALRYFKTHAPGHRKATQGIIMRKMTPRGVHIIQVFLDAGDDVIPRVNNERLPYGRRFFAGQLDQELTEAFADSPMILVK
jgi:hypothetical protein